MTSAATEKPQETLNSIDKTLSVIDCIFEQKSTFVDIQKKLNLPKATLHRILQSLENYEMIEKDPQTDAYSLGMKFIYYGVTAKSRLSLPDIAREHLEKLSEEIGESAAMSILYQDVSLSLLSCQGAASALTSNLVPFSPLNCCASGKIFLAGLDDNTLSAYFNSEKPVKKTVNSVTTFEEFKAHQNSILKDRISVDDEEYEYGLYCMSTPLYNHKGKMNVTVGITAPKARLFMQDVDQVAVKLLETAEKISNILVKIKYECEF